MTSTPRRFTTKQAATQVGVSKDTLLDWLYKGRIPEPPRDWRGWRVWGEEHIRTALEWNNQIQPATERPPAPARRRVREVTHS